MKRFILCIALTICSILTISAQSYKSLWKQVDSQQGVHPRTALATLDRILDKATREQNHLQRYKAELHIAEVWGTISTDSVAPCLQRIRRSEEEMRTKEPVMAALYELYLANAATDSTNYLQMAMQKADLLAHAKTDSYKGIVKKGAFAKIFNNDMLHVIGYAANAYDDMHRYYTQHGNRDAAVVTALDALQQGMPRQLSAEASNSYRHRIDSLRRLTSHPQIALKADLMRYMATTRREKLDPRQQMQLIDSLLSLYPRNKMLNGLRNDRARLTQSSASALDDRFNYTTADDIGLLVRHKNIRQLQVTLQRVNTSIFEALCEQTYLRGNEVDRYKQHHHVEPKPVKSIHLDFQVTDELQRKTTEIEIGKLPIGVYLLTMQAEKNMSQEAHIIVVYGIRAISVSLPNGQNCVTVVNSVNGKPVKGAHLQIDELPSVACNEQGIAIINRQKNATTVRIFDEGGTEGLPFMLSGYNRTYRGSNQKAKADTLTNIYLDRPIYRLGQKVHATAIQHTQKGDELQACVGNKLRFYLNDDDDDAIDSLVATTDEYGTAHVEFTLPQKGMHGHYSIEAADGDIRFEVEEYKRPTFEVELLQPKEAFAYGDSLHIKGTARYLTGLPVQNATVAYTIGSQDGGSRMLSTNAKGEFEIPMHISPSEQEGYKNYEEIKLTVTDRAGESHDAELELRKSKHRYEISTTLPGIIERDSLHNICFNVSNMAYQPQKVNVDWWIEGYEQTTRKRQLANTYEPFTMPEAMRNGKYRIMAVCGTDSLKKDIVVFSLNDTQPVYDTDLWFYQTSGTFSADNGRPVTIECGSSRDSVYMAYYIMSREKLIKSGAIELNNSIWKRSFTYQPSYGEGISVRTIWIKDGNINSHQFHINKPLPEKELMVKWNTFRNRLTPGQEEEWQVQVSHLDGKPAQAQLMATLYDRSLDLIKRADWNFYSGLSRNTYNIDYNSTYTSEMYMLLKSDLHLLDTPNAPSQAYVSRIVGTTTTIKGKVTDEDGEPLIGASVYLTSNPKRSVITDIDGNYAIKASIGQQLEIAYIGCETVKRRITGYTMNVKMPESHSHLDEVVVTGRGTSKQRPTITGSLRKYAMTGSASINIRGAGSEAYKKQLVIVDGVAYDASILDSLDPMQIASSAVLKGSAAVNLYGARANNGVIIITTKGNDDQKAADQLNQIPLRKNLNELAFFSPALVSDAKGRINLKFTLPESLTAWHLKAMAHTPDMHTGNIDATAVASKSLMVQPNMARFVRRGDKATLQARIINAAPRAAKGKVRMTIADPETEKEIAAYMQNFNVSADSSTVVTFHIDMPTGNGTAATAPDLYVVKVVASANGQSDGEQHYLVQLPAVEQVTATRAFMMHGEGQKKIDLTRLFPASAIGSKLTIEHTAHPQWMVLQALQAYAHPYDDCALCQSMSLYATMMAQGIVENSPEVQTAITKWADDSVSNCSVLLRNDELKELSVAETPWLADAKNESEQHRQLASFLDEEAADAAISKATDALKSLQTSSGAWTWFKGMRGSTFITEAVTELLVRLKAMVKVGYSINKMIDCAFEYLDKQEDASEEYLYLCALDGRLPQGKARKELKKTIADFANSSMMRCARWAVILSKKNPELARQLVETLKQHSIFDVEHGRRFDTNKAYYSWFSYQIPTQVAAIEAIAMVTPDDRRTLAEMQQWLLQEKHAQSWNTTINTADAVHAFMIGQSGMSDEQGTELSLKIDGRKIVMGNDKGITGYSKVSTEPTGRKLLSIGKAGKGTSFGAVYAQYFQPIEDIEAQGTELKVSRRIVPVTPGPLRVGSKVRVIITIEAARNLDFVQIVDRRAACMEPTVQTSGYRWGYYCDRHNTQTRYFIEQLSKGKHTIEDEYYIDRTGTYRTGSITAQCAYAPEYTATGKAATIVVK